MAGTYHRKRRFAISDIHGCANTFKRLLRDKLHLTLDDELYLLGDYVNRGPDSKGVIDHIIYLRERGVKVHTLRGNHDDILLKARYSKHFQRVLQANGGNHTLASFGARSAEEIPAKYFDFLRDTELYIALGHCYLVHAGFNFDLPDFLQDTEAMMYIRKMPPEPHQLGDNYLIHGHTAASKMDVRRQMNRQPRPRILNIDAGCVYTKRFGARLCALDLDTFELYFSKNVDVE